MTKDRQKARRKPARARVTGWTRVIGGEPEAFSDAFWSACPEWVRGSSISHFDARFLFRKALDARAPAVVEIGTASGFSTGLLCHALAFASKAKKIGSEYRVVTYDIDPQFYADRSRGAGDAAREQLPPHLLEHVVFRAPATVADMGRDFTDGEVGFLFLDANHGHPWPTLDLMGALDYLAPGATVVLHDINLPVIHPEFPERGAKALFDSLSLGKDVEEESGERNIGAIEVPSDKDDLREELLRILYDHPWQNDVPVELTTDILA